MSLIDDARRLAEPAWYRCESCDAIRTKNTGFPPQRHASGCPWLALPRVVAALEAADALAYDEPVFYDESNEHVECLSCGATSPRNGPLESHRPDCPWQVLVAALKGTRSHLD